MILHPLIITLIDSYCHECLLGPPTIGHHLSPHMGIILSRPQSATPSGVPQYEQQFVFIPIRTSHDFTHSTGLPKPPGCFLKWPRVTPKLCRILIAVQFSTWNCLTSCSHRLAKTSSRSPGRTLGAPGASPLDFGPSPVLQHTVWRDHLHCQAPALRFCSRVHFVAYLLAVYTALLDTTLVTGNLLVFGTLE